MRLAVQGTSVSAERVFSSPVEIVNAKRAVLRSDVVDKLIFWTQTTEGIMKLIE